jgi:hypothetical protein
VDCRFCLFGFRPNGTLELYGSLELFRKNNGQHKHCWRSASLQPPSEGAVSYGYLLGRPCRPPFLLLELFATIPLTIDESISSPFRV